MVKGWLSHSAIAQLVVWIGSLAVEGFPILELSIGFAWFRDLNTSSW